MGLAIFNPDLSWTFSDPNPGDTQSAYRILVASTVAELASNIGGMWDTGKVFSAQQTVTYAGNGLARGATYYWKVMTWDSEDAQGPYSSNATFSMAQQQVNNQPPNAPQNLRCMGQTNPRGISDFTPDLSWTFSDPNTGDTQYAYRIILSSRQADLNSDTGTWNTGKVISSAQTVTYSGPTLLQGTTYYWKVMTWDNYNSSGPYSAVANFSTEVGVKPILVVDTDILDFGPMDPDEIKTMTLKISNGGGPNSGVISGTLTCDSDWIMLSQSTFFGNTDIEVTVDAIMLNATKGDFTGTITIDSNGGTAIVTVQVTATCVLIKPNPYNPTKGSAVFFGDGVVGNKTVIKIWSLNGEVIKKLKAGENDSEIQWDGKNEEGKIVTSGIYIYTYESPKEKGIGKFTVVK